MPAHHNLEAYLDEYIERAGIGQDRKAPLLRSARGKTGKLSVQAMTRIDAYRMIRSRARASDIDTEIGCHTFRVTGITDYLKNGSRIEVARRWPVIPEPGPPASTTGAEMRFRSKTSRGLRFNVGLSCFEREEFCGIAVAVRV